jgi:hypothetical protein
MVTRDPCNRAVRDARALPLAQTFEGAVRYTAESKLAELEPAKTRKDKGSPRGLFESVELLFEKRLNPAAAGRLRSRYEANALRCSCSASE